MSAELGGSLFAKGMGLKPGQGKLLIRSFWVILVTTYMLWGIGALAYLGIAAPYASAEETAAVKSDVLSIKVQLLEEALLEARLKQCKAIESGSEETKRFYFERLQEKMTAYYKATDRNYLVPTCAEIL
jgi:hypothetical protein